jgi:hypothetical protein
VPRERENDVKHSGISLVPNACFQRGSGDIDRDFDVRHGLKRSAIVELDLNRRKKERNALIPSLGYLLLLGRTSLASTSSITHPPTMSAQQPIRPPPVAVQDLTTTITSSPLPSSSSPSFAHSPAADGQSPSFKQPSSRKSFDGGLLKRMISRDRDHDGHRHDGVEGGERKEKRRTSFDVRLPTLGSFPSFCVLRWEIDG